MNDKESFVRYDVYEEPGDEDTAVVEVFDGGSAGWGVVADVTLIVRNGCDTEKALEFLDAARQTLEKDRERTPE